MRNLIFTAFAVVTLAAVAAPNKAPVLSDAEKAKKQAEAYQKLMEKTGGILDIAGKGKVAVVNCQTKFSKEVIAERVAYLRKAIRVNVDLVESAPIPPSEIFARMPKMPEGAASALYIVDDASLPISAHAPESQWGFVNVSTLNESRFARAFVRGAIFVFGCAESRFKGTAMQTITKPEDLDKIIADGIPFDAIIGITQHLENIGVTQEKKTTYRKACQEGWAAQPTNDAQRAIWKEVHELPSNPIKIKFDPKQGK